jgi:hypothetical protein
MELSGETIHRASTEITYFCRFRGDIACPMAARRKTERIDRMKNGQSHHPDWPNLRSNLPKGYWGRA